MPIALIAALAGTNRVIGKNGTLPWHYPTDMRFFKETTTGHTLIMGRTSYQGILKEFGKPLPNRKIVVLTRDKNFTDDRVTIIHDLNRIDDFVQPNQTLFITGGQQIYEQTLDRADTLLITHIDKDYDGDSFFPAIDPAIWIATEDKRITENETLLRFCTYRKIA